MVQIIQEKRKPSTSERFAQAFGNLGQTAGEAIPEYFSQKQRQELDKQALEAGKQILGVDLSGFDPETRKALLVEGLKQQGKQGILEQKQGFLKGIFPGKKEISPFQKTAQDLMGNKSEFETPLFSREKAQSTSDVEELGTRKLPYTHEQIAQASIIDPNLAKEMRAENESIAREQRENIKSKQTKEENLRKETLPLKQKIIERADLSRESIANKNRLINLIDQGNLDDPTFAVFAMSLPFNLGKRLLSDDTVEYKGGLVDEFSDLKNIFKGATRVKEVEIYEDKLADIYLTDSQKKAILKSRINSAKVDLLREEAAQEVEEKYPNVSALQFNKKVEEIMKPKMEALFNTIWDQQKSVINDAENRKKMPLDPSDPEDKKIMQQIFKEAGGDKIKAKQLTKKKGYTVKGVP